MASDDKSYDPDSSTVLDAPWSTAILSQRDLGLLVPVNFVTVPGISLSKACFSQNEFKDGDAQRCLSNLLSTGFRRIEVDLYWDPGRSVWSLCPAEINASGSQDGSTSSTIIDSSSTKVASLSSVEFDGNSMFQADSSSANGLMMRQVTTSGSAQQSSSGSLTTESPETIIRSTSAPVPSATQAAANGEIDVGPYRCTSSIDFGTITNVLAGYFAATSNTLQAGLTYLTLNLHVAAPNSSPTRPADTPEQSALPGLSSSLSQLLHVNLSSYLYTPSMLGKERQDLNSSWYSVDANAPAVAQQYFDVTALSNDRHTTVDGWPSESYIEFANGYRLLASFGSVDPQISGYNFSDDAASIFPSGYLFSDRPVNLSASSSVVSGCRFDASTPVLNAATNSSWAIYADIPISDSSIQSSTLDVLTNLTACGISPLINETIPSARPANLEPAPFVTLAKTAAIWAWASNEPYTESDDASDSNTQHQCAGLYASLAGRWRASNCVDHHYGACRSVSSPYNWTVTKSRDSFSEVEQFCPEGSIFSAPRTSLENSYLLSAIKTFISKQDDGDRASLTEEAFFLNLQSLVTPNCWVPGVNTTCPWTEDQDAIHTRAVVVPTVAAMIVFAVAALTAFVKCASNRQNAMRGRRRRGGERGDYEGVPI